jgi:CheY-like chemotaxis protein
VTDRPAEILLIEDNPSDVRLTEEAMRDMRVVNKLHIASNGEEALAFLFRKGQFAKAPRPDFILLDWNLPGVDGSEVLEIVRGDANLKSIPVIVLTSSRDQIDVVKAYHLQASAYITKPVDMSGFVTIMESCPSLKVSILAS